MRHVITSTHDTRLSLQRFQNRIAKVAVEKRRQEWKFPNGEKVKADTYYIQAKPKRLVVGLPSRWSRRVPHLFCFEGKTAPLSPVVEINIPLELDRKVSGVYVHQDEDRDVWLCTRGDFTVFRKRLPRKAVFQHFDKWLVQVEDAGRSTRVIPVASVGSPTLTEDIVAFLKTVIELKAKFKEGRLSKAIEKADWSTGKESEGKRKGKRTSGEFEYEYLHGPLCNSLQAALKNLPSAGRDFAVKRNKHVDLAVLKNGRTLAIFEVKTSASMSKQLYAGIGQLLYYRQKYGGPWTKLFLVLPSVSVMHGFPHRQFFETLKIVVLSGQGGSFRSLSGRTLKAVLTDTKCIGAR